jgi:Leucine-rich repeat (LRR) protein
MKQSLHLFLILSISIIACDKQENLEPIVENDACETYIPFYEQQDSNALSLSVECNCQDSFVDLTTKLAAYTDVVNFNFNCDANQFDLIPEMPSVTHLTSDVITSNIQAFPNLEVYKNKLFMDRPLPYQITFLPNLREVVLLNVINFPSFISTKPLDVFKMTFQSTESREIILPANLHTLANLTELNIRNVNLSMFTDFDDLVNLQTLKLSNTLWVRVPSTSNQWPKLKTLELSEIELRGSIADMFEDMDSLETIHIERTVVSTVSQERIYKAPNLKELTLSFCELGSIPEDIGNLTTLNKLIITTDQNLINTPITLPSSVGSLNNLKSIFVSTNSNQFPMALLGLKTTLESMAIQDNIGVVPSEIGDFTVLKTLKLTNCGLTNLPSEIQNLANTLDKLYLAGNNFGEGTKEQIENWLPNTDIYF